MPWTWRSRCRARAFAVRCSGPRDRSRVPGWLPEPVQVQANLISCDAISKAYGVRMILHGVSLGVQRGDRVGVVGRNGEGKTTLMRILGGYEPPDDGRVTRNRGLRVRMLSQVDELDDDRTVAEIVLGDLAEHEWAADPRARDVVEHLLEGIALDRVVEGLSGGERRRVALAA